MTYPHGGPRAIWRDGGAARPQKSQIRDYVSVLQARLETIFGAPVAGSLYHSTAEGIAAVADGGIFGIVPSNDAEIIQIYQRSGSAAVLVKSYPNPERIEEGQASFP